jgi:hypothetical protein
LTESKEPGKTIAPEEAEDEVFNKEEKKKKARLRTRGPYRKASARNLPDACKSF